MKTPSEDSSAADRPGDDAWLETALRDAVGQYVPDEGFSARVVGALPPRPTAPAWRRAALIGGAAVAGTVFAFALGGADILGLGDSLVRSVSHWVTQPVSNSSLTVAVVATLALSAAVVWTTLRRATR
jgi:hypothetical protein